MGKRKKDRSDPEYLKANPSYFYNLLMDGKPRLPVWVILYELLSPASLDRSFLILEEFAVVSEETASRSYNRFKAVLVEQIMHDLLVSWMQERSHDLSRSRFPPSSVEWRGTNASYPLIARWVCSAAFSADLTRLRSARRQAEYLAAFPPTERKCLSHEKSTNGKARWAALPQEEKIRRGVESTTARRA